MPAPPLPPNPRKPPPIIPAILANWKTTVQGAASLVIALSASAAFMGQLPPKWTAITLSAAGLAKVIIGLLQTDAKTTQTALTPSGSIEEVAAHRVPDNPADIPVVK